MGTITLPAVFVFCVLPALFFCAALLNFWVGLRVGHRQLRVERDHLAAALKVTEMRLETAEALVMGLDTQLAAISVEMVARGQGPMG